MCWISKSYAQAYKSISLIDARQRLPGYSQLTRRDRLRTDFQALLSLFATDEALRMIYCLTVWQLSARNAAWTFDLHPDSAALLHMAALLWLMPWIANARSRHIARVLGKYWLKP